VSEIDADLAKAPDPEIALPDLPKKPEDKPNEEQRTETEAQSQPQTPSEAHAESAPTSAPRAETLIAPEVSQSAGSPDADPAAMVIWRATLAAHVQQFKRYPAQAVERHWHGTSPVRFTIDRRGEIISAEPVSNSGIEVLDQESLSLIARAAPLPAPPHHIRGNHFTFTIPIQFHQQH
jgi:protein TonB